MSPVAARFMAGIKLSYAAMLRRDIVESRRKGRDVIGGFNVSRTDGSPIVKGCSTLVWKRNREQALSEALALLEMAEKEG